MGFDTQNASHDILPSWSLSIERFLVRDAVSIRIRRGVNAVGPVVDFLSHDARQHELHIKERDALRYQISAGNKRTKIECDENPSEQRRNFSFFQKRRKLQMVQYGSLPAQMKIILASDDQIGGARSESLKKSRKMHESTRRQRNKRRM